MFNRFDVFKKNCVIAPAVDLQRHFRQIAPESLGFQLVTELFHGAQHLVPGHFILIMYQDVVLFNNTIMENIRIGKKDATDEEVIAAAKAARCDEFISKLPDGYETVIGENGSTLSGGECQRLSIARALLKGAPVILLDEATASLDVDNETEIQNAISRLVKGKTVLIIAHRMRTVEAADKIVVLSDGIVAESGTHEELMKENGLYHRLVDLQTASANWKLSV